MNAIDDDVPAASAAAVAQTDADPDVHVMLLSGNGAAFCSGYDLTFYAQQQGGNPVVQEMHWDPMQDYAFMWLVLDAVPEAELDGAVEAMARRMAGVPVNRGAQRGRSL